MDIKSIIKNNKEPIIYILVVGIFLSISIGYFIFIFSKQSVTANMQSWGTFGDYIGGVVGTFFTFLNVVVLYILTIKVTKINNKINEIQIKQQSYQVYFTSINKMFFKVLKNYTSYRISLSNGIYKESEKLGKIFEISIDLLYIYIENIPIEVSEQISEHEKIDLDKVVDDLKLKCTDLKNGYTNNEEENQHVLITNFTESKSRLIQSVNKNLKVESL
jgi:signal recognition particle subunit SEC65